MHNGSTFNHRYVKQNPQEVENATWMLTAFAYCFLRHPNTQTLSFPSPTPRPPPLLSPFQPPSLPPPPQSPPPPPAGVQLLRAALLSALRGVPARQRPSVHGVSALHGGRRGRQGVRVQPGGGRQRAQAHVAGRAAQHPGQPPQGAGLA
ncbi:unnamed protein product [Closterium sp. NIES-53]